VEHHPPTSAIFIKGSKDSPFSAQIHFRFLAIWHGTWFQISPCGVGKVKLEKYDEEINFDHPELFLYPLRWGSEWTGTCNIKSSTKMRAEIKFLSKVL
jgi:hypothetical protein